MRNRCLLTISLVFMLWLSDAAKGLSAPKSRVDSIRQELPKLEGKERMQAYYKIYNLYYYSGETQKERQAIDDLLAEAERQGDVKMQATARTALLYYYYNTDLDDSLLAEYPKHQTFMLNNQDWKLYYDIWVLIVNHYIFTSQSNTALREVKKMYEDAQQRDNSYGIGLASYGMGNAYMDIGFHEEAIQAYERCIKALSHSEMGSPPYWMSIRTIVRYFLR